jgi:hypothetical protein
MLGVEFMIMYCHCWNTYLRECPKSLLWHSLTYVLMTFVTIVRMAQQHHDDDDIEPDEHDVATGYKPPAQKSVADIIKSDAEDESLRKYKEALLGSALTGAVEVCMSSSHILCLVTCYS